jgi:putative addiction module component (TIGR02574 family)
MTAAAVKNEALNLSPTERAQLIDALWDSLASDEIKAREAAWAEESERRVEAVKTGKLKTFDAKEVMSELRERFKK